MRKSVHIVCLCMLWLLNSASALGQSDSIYTRDTILFNYQIKNVILPEYEKLLNMIADNSFTQNEIDQIIEVSIAGDKRIFENDRTIIESDLIPSSKLEKPTASDMDIRSYLKNFTSGYAKSEEKSVFFKVNRISALKKSSNYYVKVFFESVFSNLTSTGLSYSPQQRVAEVVVKRQDKGWKLYISGIRFKIGSDENDTLNNYAGIVNSNSDIEKIIRSYQDDRQLKLLEDQRKAQSLIEEGDDQYEARDYEGALKKYREAKRMFPDLKEAKTAIDKTREALNNQKKKEEFERQRALHMFEMRKSAFNYQRTFDFKLAKMVCDSLLKDYNDVNDSIRKLNEQVSKILSAATSIDAAIAAGDLKTAIKVCDAKIAESSDDIAKAELYYSKATVYMKLDSANKKRILECLNQSISYSRQFHQSALTERSKLFQQQNNLAAAIEDATTMINNDSRNANLYTFRAAIYEQLAMNSKALDDYSSAILNNPQYREAYYKKAKLELDGLSYQAAIKTCSDGISACGNKSGLYFLRGLAYNKISQVRNAGLDFYKEKQCCALSQVEETAIHGISSSYYSVGIELMKSNRIQGAIDALMESVTIDSSVDAAFLRCKLLNQTGQYKEALMDVEFLVSRKLKPRNLYSEKGYALMGIDQDSLSEIAFQAEIMAFPDNAEAQYRFGNLLMKMRKYGDAGAQYAASGKSHYSDSAWTNALKANYLAGRYDESVKCIDLALKPKVVKTQAPYEFGAKSYLALRNYSEAIHLLQDGLHTFPQNEDLLFLLAKAFDGDGRYKDAADRLGMLEKSKLYGDSARLPRSVCLIKSNDLENISIASRKIAEYIRNTPDSACSEAYAWLSYAYSCLNKPDDAAQALAKVGQAGATRSKQVIALAQAALDANAGRVETSISALKLLIISDFVIPDCIKGSPAFQQVKKQDAFKNLINGK